VLHAAVTLQNALCRLVLELTLMMPLAAAVSSMSCAVVGGRGLAEAIAAAAAAN
jgi:hypothetical protein